MYYTYSITDLTNGIHYYGSRTSKTAKYDDILKRYFSSSKVVNEQIKLKGIDNFSCKVRRTFKTKEECFDHERRFLNRVNASKNERFYNIDTNQDPSKAIQNTTRVIALMSLITGKYIRWPKSKPIPDGFIKKAPPKKTSSKGFKWYHNPTTGEATMARRSPGADWIRGRGPKYRTNSKTLLSKKLSWYTDGEESLLIEAGGPIPKGWVKGKTHKTKPSGKRHHRYIWVTMNGESIQIPEFEFDDTIHERKRLGIGRYGSENASSRRVRYDDTIFDTLRECIRTTGLSRYYLIKDPLFEYLD